MKKSSIKSITLSNLYFYQKIMVKYQKDRKNPFRLPVLIFSKNAKRLFPQRINMDILMRFYFYNQNKMSNLIFNSAESLKNLFSWFMTEKVKPLLKVESKSSKNIQNMYEMLKLIQPEFISRTLQNIPANRPEFSSGNIGSITQAAYNTSSQLLNFQLIFSLKNIALYPQTSFNISSQGRTVNNYLLNHGSHVHIVKPQILLVSKRIEKENPGNFLITVKETGWEYKTAFEHESSVNIPQAALLLNKRISTKTIDGHFTGTYQNWTAADKSFIRKYDYDLASTVSSLTGKRSTSYQVKNESFVFQNQRQMEEEIEQIKKIMIKTKESLENSLPSQVSQEKAIKSKIDIDIISDQVYHNIERRIKTERERRGL